MVKISGWVYLIIGIFVSGYSRYVQSRIDSPGMALFFWVGVVFLGVGVFKIVLFFIFKEKNDKIQKNNGDSIQDKIVSNFGFDKSVPNYDSEKIKREKELILNRTKNIVVCSKCGTKHYSNSNFCHMCGTRLK